MLNIMPVGTNFLVTPEQLQELNDLISYRFPKSIFHKAVNEELRGKKLDVQDFENSFLIYEGKKE